MTEKFNCCKNVADENKSNLLKILQTKTNISK